MCGIAGIFRFDGQPVANAEQRIRKMTALLKHRGPDSQGTYVSPDGFLALGNTRLAIVDPQATLHQPLETPRGDAVLSFNGEIYNYQDEKRRLEQKGISFRSHMDTEVLLEGLKLEGEKFLEGLDGMWSFAYYDSKTRRLLLGRDLMGERHLFYRVHDGEITFASEVNPLLIDSNASFEVDFESFLTSLRYFAPAPGRSMICGVERMLPGHHLAVEVGGSPKQYRVSKLHPEKWFDFFNAEPDLEKTIAQFGTLFHKLCKRRIPQEVPFLCTLSGGLDSALICLYASDFGKTPIRTLYGQSYDKPPKKGEDLDEYQASLETSKKLHTDHNHIFLNSDEAAIPLKRLAENAFDGMFDNAVAAFEMLSRYVARQQAKVILIAEGPDEFLGYPKDLHLPLLSTDPFRFSPINESWDENLFSKILSPEQKEGTSQYYGVGASLYNDLRPHMDDFQWKALSYATYSLPDMFNLRTDKAYMNASVEARLPYQAPELVEFLIAIPSNFRFNGGKTTKYLMRQIAEKHIGPQVAGRSKYGFAAPIWRSPNIVSLLQYDKVVAESPIFEKFPFKKGVRDFILSPENQDLLWSFYALTRVEERLRRRDYL